MALTDDEILSIVRAEREAALGDGDELATERARNYDYFYADTEQGAYKRDLPVLAGQSAAVSTDVSDAVETVLPDLMEIFAGGDDAVSFSPVSKEDTEAADQETAYVNHVFFVQNDGWMVLYEHIKDALISKTGIFKWWWEESDDFDEMVLKNKNPDEMTIIRAQIRNKEIELSDREEDEIKADPETGLTTLRVKKKVTRKRARVITVAPEDFFIDRNSTKPSNATMCGHHATMRAFDLLEQGFDADLVSELKDADRVDDEDGRARSSLPDADDEAQQPVHSNDLMRRVEITEYHIKLDVEGDDFEFWKIITGNDDAILLDKEKIASIQFATNCPYPTTHRFYGRSIADLLIDVQRIKTALLRSVLNMAYYGVNPRPVIDMKQATKATISDMLDNRPGKPIRANGPNAVTWQQPPTLGFDIFGALEYMATVGEGRTGVVRNAQGLNPDTLHDTAKGAMELMSAAQRKVRMIARLFAENGIKDLFLGLHDLIVRHGRKAETVRLRNEWVEIDPNEWNRRKDLNIDVGLGSNTQSQEQAFWGGIIGLQKEAREIGLADDKNLYNSAKKLLAAGNVREPEEYFINPEKREKEGEGQKKQPTPDPAVIKVQGELQIKQQKAQQDAAAQQAEFQLKAKVAEAEINLKREKAQIETQIALLELQIEKGSADERLEAETRLKELQIRLGAQTDEFSAFAKAANDSAQSSVRFGGRIG